MIKTICSVFFVLSFTLSAQALSGGGGGMDIGGGSGLALLFRQHGFQVAKLIGKTQKFPLTQEQFENLIRTTRVELSEKPVLDANGASVAARVRPDLRLITLNIEKARAIFFAPTSILPFVAHVYLEASGNSDQNYEISNKLFKARGLLTSIVCETLETDVMETVEKVTFQEIDHDGDGIADIRNAAAYDEDINTGELMNENEPPLINKNQSGVLLVTGSMNILTSKIFLPQAFLDQKSARLDIPSYFVDMVPTRETGVYKTFSCRHVENESPKPPVDPSRGWGKPPGEQPPPTDESDELIKGSAPFFIKSIRAQAEYAADMLHLLPGFPLSKERFKDLIQKTTIELTTQALYEPGGMEVDALNYPHQNLIRFNFFRTVFSGVKPKVMLQLVVHEFLGLAQIPDPDYSVSSRVWALPSRVTLEMTCDTQSNSGSHDQIIYRQVDINGDGMDDTKELVASRIFEHGPSQNLQTPFFTIDTSPTEIAIVGYQVVWSSGEKNYVTYWKIDDLDGSASFQADYHELGQNGYDRFKKPPGKMSCQISRVPKFVY